MVLDRIYGWCTCLRKNSTLLPLIPFPTALLRSAFGYPQSTPPREEGRGAGDAKPASPESAGFDHGQGIYCTSTVNCRIRSVRKGWRVLLWFYDCVYIQQMLKLSPWAPLEAVCVTMIYVHRYTQLMSGGAPI